jgi:hypothetical protein
MEWAHRMNGVINYIEAHLCDDIDTEQAQA